MPAKTHAKKPRLHKTGGAERNKNGCAAVSYHRSPRQLQQQQPASAFLTDSRESGRIVTLSDKGHAKMQLRCKNTACNKLLAVGSGDIQIKCPRCKQINQFKISTSHIGGVSDPQQGRTARPIAGKSV